MSNSSRTRGRTRLSGARQASPLMRLPQSPSSRRKRRRARAVLVSVAVVLLASCALWYTLRPARPVTAVAPAPTARGAASTPDVAVGGGGDGIKIASFLGGSLRRSYGIGPAPATLDLVWKFKIGSGFTRRKSDEKPVLWSGAGWTGQCTVVRDKGRDYLLLGGYDHNLHKIDAETGVQVWKCAFDDVIKGTNTVIANPHPTSEADRIIVVSGSRRGSSYKVRDPRIAPLRAVSFTTGKELWRLPVPKSLNYSQDVDSSPLLFDGVLYAPVEPGYVYALDPFHTRKVGAHREPIVLGRSPRLFTAADARAHPDTGGANVALEASPARVGDMLYVGSGSGHVYGLRLPALEIAWDFHTASDIDGTAVIGRDGRLLQTIEKEYVKQPGGVYAFDATRTPASSPDWYFPTPNRGIAEWQGGAVGSIAVNDESNPAGHHPRLAAFISVDGPLRVLAPDALTARTARGPGASSAVPVPTQVFSAYLDGGISTPIIVGDSLIAAGYDRKVHLYRITYTRAADGAKGALASPDGSSWKVAVSQKAVFKAGGVFESTPIVWGGHVYIASRDGYLYCLGTR